MFVNIYIMFVGTLQIIMNILSRHILEQFWIGRTNSGLVLLILKAFVFDPGPKNFGNLCFNICRYI